MSPRLKHALWIVFVLGAAVFFGAAICVVAGVGDRRLFVLTAWAANMAASLAVTALAIAAVVRGVRVMIRSGNEIHGQSRSAGDALIVFWREFIPDRGTRVLGVPVRVLAAIAPAIGLAGAMLFAVAEIMKS